MSTVVPEVEGVLPEPIADRISVCGEPYPRLVRESGEEVEASHLCRDQWCVDCGRTYRQRVYACVRAAVCRCGPLVDECRCEPPVMLTTTVRSTPAASLDSQWDAVARHRTRTLARLRAHDVAHRRLELWRQRGDQAKIDYWEEECRRRVPHPRDVAERAPRAESIEKFASTWCDDELGFERASGGRTTYIWAMEVTRGADGDRWHVHLHWLVPTRADAERLQAAWQAERHQRPLCNCDILEWDGAGRDGRSDTEEAVSYLTKSVSYSTKGAALQSWSTWERWTYVRAVRGRVRYCAGGRYRPLGIGHDDPDDPVRWVYATDDGVVEQAAPFFSHSGSAYDAWRWSISALTPPPGRESTPPQWRYRRWARQAYGASYRARAAEEVAGARERASLAEYRTVQRDCELRLRVAASGADTHDSRGSPARAGPTWAVFSPADRDER